jgi:hypothetical protein
LPKQPITEANRHFTLFLMLNTFSGLLGFRGYSLWENPHTGIGKFSDFIIVQNALMTANPSHPKG